MNGALQGRLLQVSKTSYPFLRVLPLRTADSLYICSRPAKIVYDGGLAVFYHE